MTETDNSSLVQSAEPDKNVSAAAADQPRAEERALSDNTTEFAKKKTSSVSGSASGSRSRASETVPGTSRNGSAASASSARSGKRRRDSAAVSQRRGSRATGSSGKPAPGGRSRNTSAAARGRKNSADIPKRRRRTAAGIRRDIYAARQPLTESFSHAFDGIFAGTGERNFQIHSAAALLVVVFGLLLHISAVEWCICLTLFGLVMGLELVNTAVEAVVDLVTEEYRPLAKKAKDTAAGAVLIAAVMAAIAGLIIFIPRFLYTFRII